MTITPRQRAEWEPARVVLLCEPNIETLFALLQIDAANFLRPFSLGGAREEHRRFRAALEARGVMVLDLRAALAGSAEADPAARRRLETWAAAAVTYRFDDAIPRDERASMDTVRAAMVRAADARTLADLILLRPMVHLTPNPEALDTTSRYLSRFEVHPAHNSYYMRDPLMTTAAGCVIGRLRLAARRPENEIAAQALVQLGITPLCRVQPPGFLEGGDFLPCGDFALQGQGLLSDADGIGQCLDERAYGYVEVGVVRDERARMDEMHLDTYFCVLDHDLCALCDERFGADEPAVDVYRPEGTPEAFRYRRARTLGLTAYLREKGMAILPFSKAEQEAFAPNGLLLGPRRFLAARQSGDAWAGRLRDTGVLVERLDFAELTGGYGGPHCSSQVLARGGQ